jgi:hypothetical protein
MNYITNKISLILLAFLFMGCGARKVEKFKEELRVIISTHQKDTLAIKSNVKEVSIISETSEELIYEPINDSIEMVIDKKIYKNVKIKQSKGTKDNQVSKVIDNILNESSEVKNDVKVNKVIEEKKVDRESFQFPWIIIALAVAGYILYSRK